MRCILAFVVLSIAVSSSSLGSATSIQHKLHKIPMSTPNTVGRAVRGGQSSPVLGNPLQCLGNLSAAWYTGIMGAHSWMEAATQDCVNKTKLQEDPHACQDEIVKGAARLTEAAADIRKLTVACNRSNTKCGQDLKAVGTAVQDIASDSLEVWLSCKKHIQNVKELDACLIPLFNMTAEAKSVKKSLLSAVQNCGERVEDRSNDVEAKDLRA